MKNVKNIHKFLILKALEKVTNEHQILLIKNIDEDNCSQADVFLLNQIAYGNPEGIDVDIKEVKVYIKNFDEKRETLIKEKTSKFGF